MQLIKRRQFLRHMSATAGSMALVACGGGAGGATSEEAPSSQDPQGPSQGSHDPVLADPLPVGARAAGFDLVSKVDAMTAPFCLGHGFRKGAVPSSTTVVGSIADVQVAVKNRWPDGSLRFAVIAGRAPLEAGVPLHVSLHVAAQPAVPAVSLGTADLGATGISASIDCGAFGSAEWKGDDWGAPFLTWIAGPSMSSWIYRRPIGTDAHLVAWLEVRLFAGGAVEVLPWIENGYLLVAAPTNKRSTYSFAMGGTQRFSQAFDLPNHCRTPLLAGSMVSHWLGTDPDLIVRHDKAYMQSTNLVPSYGVDVAPTEPVVTSLVSSYMPLQRGNLPSGMGNAGYSGHIGLLPEWDVLYLTAHSDASYKAVQFNAYSAGRYGTHYRDENTNRPIKFGDWPHIGLSSGGSVGMNDIGISSKSQTTPLSTGTSPQYYAISHHPSMGYMAYLTTGRFYFMEELQFVATLNYLKQRDVTREFAGGVFLTQVETNQIRGAAWAIRTLAQAASATPDDDPLHADFIQSVEANADWNHARHVAKPSCPQGFVHPQVDYSGTGDGVLFGPTWMHDFWVAAVGYMLALDLPISSEGKVKLQEFFAWNARSVVGRLGGAGADEWLFRDCAVYSMAMAPADYSSWYVPNWADGSGPWYQNWGQMYAATYAGYNGKRDGPWNAYGPKEVGDGSIRGGVTATGNFANMQPAIAYAVQHGVAGAAEGYAKLTNAPNWPAFQKNLEKAPVWSIIPA